jgi:hypothetical protein
MGARRSSEAAPAGQRSLGIRGDGLVGGRDRLEEGDGGGRRASSKPASFERA